MAGLFSPSALVRAFGGYTSFEVCAVFARHTPGWIRAGFPGMGGSAFQSGTQVGVPSLPSVLDFSRRQMVAGDGFEPPPYGL